MVGARFSPYSRASLTLRSSSRHPMSIYKIQQYSRGDWMRMDCLPSGEHINNKVYSIILKLADPKIVKIITSIKTASVDLSNFV